MVCIALHVSKNDIGFSLIIFYFFKLQYKDQTHAEQKYWIRTMFDVYFLLLVTSSTKLESVK